MVDDKWIGLALAVSSSAAIGVSSIITKKVRSHAARPGRVTDRKDDNRASMLRRTLPMVPLHRIT